MTGWWFGTWILWISIVWVETTNQMIIDVWKIVEIFDIPYRSLFDIFVDVWFAMLYVSVQLKGNT